MILGKMVELKYNDFVSQASWFDNGLYMCTFCRVFGSQGKLIIQIILKIRNLSR